MRTLIWLLLFSTGADACQIAMSVSAPTATPAMSVTKRWNDTDANCQIMGDALIAASPVVPKPTDRNVVFGQWFTDQQSELTALTNRYLKATAPITPVDPAPQ
jgi:hypothetical protein